MVFQTITVSDCCLIKCFRFFIWKVYLYFNIGNGQLRELCQLYWHTFVLHATVLMRPMTLPVRRTATCVWFGHFLPELIWWISVFVCVWSSHSTLTARPVPARSRGGVWRWRPPGPRHVLWDGGTPTVWWRWWEGVERDREVFQSVCSLSVLLGSFTMCSMCCSLLSAKFCGL